LPRQRLESQSEDAVQATPAIPPPELVPPVVPPEPVPVLVLALLVVPVVELVSVDAADELDAAPELELSVVSDEGAHAARASANAARVETSARRVMVSFQGFSRADTTAPRIGDARIAGTEQPTPIMGAENNRF
jgi:hypothetical protein